MRTFGRTVGRDAGPAAEPAGPRYRGRVRVSFPALLTLHRPTPANPAPRPYLHDLTAEFVFEAASLVEPGVVVDNDMRAEIEQHVATRLAHRDLNRLFDRPPTCEVLAGHLANWHWCSARPPGHARLVAVTVTDSAGGHGEIHLPQPSPTGSPDRGR